MGGTRPVSTKGVCSRTTVGLGAESLLLEGRHEREPVALSGRTYLCLCPECGCAGVEIPIRRDRLDQPGGRGEFFCAFPAAARLRHGGCRAGARIQLSLLQPK